MINLFSRKAFKRYVQITLLVLFSASVWAQPGDMRWIKDVGARKTPNTNTVFYVNSFGAPKDGVTPATKFIQQAIDVCSRNGGGIVAFKPGTYLMGAIFVKNNVYLKIGKGVLILGSTDFKDYPEIKTRIAGIEMKWPAALINIIDQRTVKVGGDGKINARGKFSWDKYWEMRKDYEARGLRWIVDYDAKRVRTFLVQSSEDVTLKDLTFSNAGFWTVQLLYSKYLTVDGITIRNNEDGHGPSTDGINIDSSSWVLVENCDIDCNDDDFCLNAGRDWDGLRVNRPTEYVVIRKCIARNGDGLLTIGSETSGGIRHVLATELTGMGTDNGFQIKSATTRGGVVENIHFNDVVMDSVENVFLFTMNWNPTYSYSTLPPGYNIDSIPDHWKTILRKIEPDSLGIPIFKNIYVNKVLVNFAKKAFNASGYEKSILTNFNFTNIDIVAATAGEINYAKDWKLENVRVAAKDSSVIEVKNSSAVNLQRP